MLYGYLASLRMSANEGSSTWRALQPTIEDRPLAVCDRLSVDITDLVAADKVYPTRVGEVYYLKFSEKQKWYRGFSNAGERRGLSRAQVLAGFHDSRRADNIPAI
ncbi:MAG: hypothetical protein M1840_000221 [Geoglossum simile]|nr:MAG: hypothetical protein M1840_000221 [Geoglossum simile]